VDLSTGTSTELLQSLELADGESRRIELELGHLLRGRLEGRVLKGGAPLARATVFISGTLIGRDGKRRSARGSHLTLTTDAEGRFAASVTPATYSVEVRIDDRAIPAAGRARVEPGGSAQQDFHVRLAQVRLRALASDGKTPLAGVSLWLTSTDPEWAAQGKDTDALGWTSPGAVPLGVYTVSAWPKRLATPGSRQELEEQDLAAATLDLGPLSIDVEDAEVARDIVMPAGSGW
jgi:hypothetical protein